MLFEKLDKPEIDGINLIEELKEIEKGIDHSKEIINQLLQFSRQSEPEMKPVDIAKVMAETLAFLNHELAIRGIRVSQAFQEPLPPVMADANQLKQTFINIIINAAQAIEKKGGIALSAAKEIVDRQPWLTIKFKDNGSGMTEDVRKSIFDPFFTTKQANAGVGGSGLGLAVSYGIIQNHGGTIEVESELGKGSLFIIRLPLSKPKLDLEKTAISKNPGQALA